MNEEKKTNKAASFGTPGGMAMLRAAVAAYLIYLGFSLIRDMLSGASTMSPTMAWLCGMFFMLVGVVFALYAWRRFRSETVPSQPEDDPDDPEE